MATPKPGEIRCPTCHRSTPPAAFCTQCGSAIPTDARIRPRGLDRDELQERIRARRSGAEPYRRGGTSETELPGFERFEPEPEDSRARRGHAADARRHDQFQEAPEPPPPAPPPPSRSNVTRDDDEWARPAAPIPAAAPVEAEQPPPVEEPAYVDNFDDAAYEGDDAYAYEYDDWEETGERRSSGAGAFAILGFLALGVLALLGGAVLSGIFLGDPGVGQVDPTPTPTAPLQTADPTGPAETTEPNGEETPAATAASPGEGEPVVFPDGFEAEAQPCIPGSPSTDGCDSNAITNSGSLWVWVGFENGTEDDVIGAEVIGPEGNTVGEGSIDLARIGCRPTCPGGWTYFPFTNLSPGEYEVQITRNGEPAGVTSFEVT